MTIALALTAPDPALAERVHACFDELLVIDAPDAEAVAASGCDWVLRLRAGEAPSDALLEALPRLTADRRVSWFDVELRAPGEPPRFEPRLLRNIAGILGGTGEHRVADGAIHRQAAAPKRRLLRRRAPAVRAVPAAPPPGDPHAGRLELLGTPATVRAGVVHQQELRIVNESAASWPAGDDEALPIRVGWRWRTGPDAPVLRDGRDLLTMTLRPGEALHQVLTVVTPDAPGDHLLEVELVHEHVRWFGTPARATLSVVVAREHRLLA